MSRHIADRLLDGIVIFQIDRNQDLLRDLCRGRIILHEESLEKTLFRLAFIFQKIGRRSDDTSGAQFQFSEAHLAGVAEKTDRISIRLTRERNILRSHHGRQRLEPVTADGRALEVQRLGCLLHLRLQIPKDAVVFSLEEAAHVLHDFSVLFAGNITAARSDTAADVIVKACALFSDIARKHFAAGLCRKDIAQRLKRTVKIAA